MEEQNYIVRVWIGSGQVPEEAICRIKDKEDLGYYEAMKHAEQLLDF